jgi:O-antigen ligase
LRQVGLRTRLTLVYDPTVALSAISVLVSIGAAVVIVGPGSSSRGPLAALLVLAGAAIVLSIRPETLLLAWLALAPVFAQSAANTTVGRPLSLALYQAPPLAFLAWTLTDHPRWGARRAVDALPLGYLLFVVGSLFITANPSLAVMRSLYLTVGLGVILYYFMAFGPVKSGARDRIVAVLLIVTALEALMSILEGFTGWNLWSVAPPSDKFERSVATLASPASLGTFIGMGLMFALALLVWRGPMRLRKLALGAIFVGAPGILFTYTRAPIIATVIVATLILASRLSTRLLAVALLVLAVLSISVFWGQLTSSTVYRERVSAENTVLVRRELQEWSLRLAAERPIAGWGYDSFDRVKNEAELSSSIPRRAVIESTSHNTFLTILVEYGVLGLTLFVAPWLIVGWGALKRAVRHPDSRWFLVGCLGALTVYAGAANSIDFRFFSFIPALSWLVLGLLRRHEFAHQE